MKLIGEILAVETTGDELKVTAQTKGICDALWRNMGHLEFEIPLHEKTGQIMYVGRKLGIEIIPKK